jgi:hypothetical protein
MDLPNDHKTTKAQLLSLDMTLWIMNGEGSCVMPVVDQNDILGYTFFTPLQEGGQ